MVLNYMQQGGGIKSKQLYPKGELLVYYLIY